MNLKNILPPHLRSKVYFAVGLFGLVIGSGIVGIAALTAGGLAVPAGLTVGLTALNAIYVYVAGAFGFIAQANTPEDGATAREQVANTHDLAELVDNYEGEPLPYDVEEESEDDSEPVG